MNREERKLLRHFQEKQGSHEERKQRRKEIEQRRAARRDGNEGRDGREGAVRYERERGGLVRAAPGARARSQSLAGEVDQVAMIVALGPGGLHTGLIDRFLIAVERGGARPLLVVNKSDLLRHAGTELEELAPYRALGVPLVVCSALTGAGIEELRGHLRGALSVLVGQSGVGKSSLLNALVPGLGLRARAARASDGKGRHTTAARTLYRLPEGGQVIDTPGIREFGLWGVERRDLADYFPELRAAAPACRFGDCLHDREPDCAVRAAVERGAIPAARYASYLRVLASLVEE